MKALCEESQRVSENSGFPTTTKSALQGTQAVLGTTIDLSSLMVAANTKMTLDLYGLSESHEVASNLKSSRTAAKGLSATRGSLGDLHGAAKRKLNR